jgi:hypothetical protein
VAFQTHHTLGVTLESYAICASVANVIRALSPILRKSPSAERNVARVWGAGGFVRKCQVSGDPKMRGWAPKSQQGSQRTRQLAILLTVTANQMRPVDRRLRLCDCSVDRALGKDLHSAGQ